MEGEAQRPVDSRPVPTIRDRIVASLPDLRRFVERRMGAGLRAAAENKLRHRARHWAAARRSAHRSAIDAQTEFRAADTPAEDARPDAQAEVQDEVERLRKAIATLSESERRVLQLSQIEGRTHAEIALATGSTSEAVRKQVARALARLAGRLAP
jgi:RNA polymerase sigma factor (sigma-70 family)